MKEVLTGALLMTILVLLGVFIGVRQHNMNHRKIIRSYCVTKFEKTIDAETCISDLEGNE